MLDTVQALNQLDTLVFDKISTAVGPQADPDSYITVPDAHLLFSGDFKRVGTTGLKITGDDGQSFFIEDYFKSEKHKHLLSPEGAMLSADLVDMLAGPLAPGQMAQAGDQSASQPVIGRVETLTGSATVVRNGVSVALNIGDLVRKGDVVQTGSSSSVSIVLTDTSTFSLSPNARMVLNDFNFEEGGSNNAALINLVQGTFGFVAGQVAKSGNMRVETPVATMGIRGTAVMVEISANDGRTKFSVMLEPDGSTGSFNLYNKTTGALLATVNSSSTGWLVSPAGPLDALANQVQKTPAELQFELGVVQQLFNIVNNYQQNPITDSQKRGDLPNGPQNTGSFGSSSAVDGGILKLTLADIITQFSQFNPGGGTPTQANGQVQLPNDEIINVTVTPNRAPIAINDAPVAINDRSGDNKGDVTKNDSDPDGDPVHVVTVQHMVRPDPDGPLVPDPNSQAVTVQQGGQAVIQGKYGILTIKSDGSYTFVPNAEYDKLGAGQHGFDNFKYTISDPTNATASAILTIDLVGVNDAPTAGDDHNHVKAAGLIHGVPTLGDPLATGNVLANDSDIDTGDCIKVVGVQSGDHAGSPATGHVNSIVQGKYGFLVLLQDGSYVYTLNNFDTDTIRLAEGECATETFTYTIADENGAKTTALLTIEVKGANSSPFFTYGDTSDSVTEDSHVSSGGLLKASGDLYFNDVDSIDGHTARVVGSPTVSAPSGFSNTALGTFRISPNPVTGKVEWFFEVDNSAVQGLDSGQKITQIYKIEIDDGHGGTDVQEVRVVINGTNDAPEITLVGGNNAYETIPETNSGLFKQGTLTISDVDVRDTLSVSVDNGAFTSSGPTGGLDAGTLKSFLTVSGSASGGHDGTLTWTFNSGSQAFDYLALGQELILNYKVKVSDGTSTDSQTVTIKIVGTNDAPVIANEHNTGSVTEDATYTASDTLAKTDVDNNDRDLSGKWSIVAQSGQTPLDNTETTVKGTYGSLTIDQNGKWTYTLDNSLAQALTANDHRLETFTVKVVDSAGGFDTETVTIQVNGADENHNPVAVADTFLNVPLGWTLGPNNHLYEFVSAPQITWQDAKAAAQAAGGYLATITSDGENDAVFLQVQNKIAWLGGSDLGQEGTWRWVTEPGYTSGSEPIFYVHNPRVNVYSDWSGGEPNNRGDWEYVLSGEDYLVTWGNKSWNDLDNSWSDRLNIDGYVIEKNGTPGAHYLQITEDATANIQTAWVLANDTDTDSDHDPLTVSRAAGAGALLGKSHLGASIELSGGNFVYKPMGSQALQALGAGETSEDYFYYQVDDGHGGTSTAKVTVIVNGLNDAPDDLHFVAGSALTSAEASSNGGGLLNGKTLGKVVATDPDHGDSLKYSLGDDSDSRDFTLQQDGTLKTARFVDSDTYTLNLVATDKSGASTTQELTVWVGSNSDNSKTFNSSHGDVLAFGLGGKDTITGYNGNDVISGGAGNDTLKGGKGNDTLIGGTGNDTLTGGDDRDTFVFRANEGHDTITDMSIGSLDNSTSDIIRLEGFSGQVSLVENSSHDIRIVLGLDHWVDLAGVDYTDANKALLLAHNLQYAAII